MAIDERKLEQFLGRVVGDIGAGIHAALVMIGDKLGLYRAMGDGAPVTAADLAGRTGTDARYVQEWLNANAAGGYVEYDAATGTYRLTEEQALALAVDDSPVYMPGAFQIIGSILKDEPKLVEAFRTGKGFGWHEHHHDLFEGTERFFRPSYNAHLVSRWIPSLDGVREKLETGASVADVGCGLGASTIVMAKAFPRSRFHGFDYHEDSIRMARRRAEDAGVDGRVTFDVARSKDFPGASYDLVAFFDCLHDMGDPAGAARHVRSSLASDGTWMIVEPFAHDRVEDNLNPVGRVYYSASTVICTPASRSQDVGACLGAQAGESRLREVVTAGGFSRFRRATETPFNLVLEARP